LDLSVITGDGVRDDCHTLVLAASSPVFAACSPGPDSCLLLPDFTSADFLNLLGVLYGGPTRLVSTSPHFNPYFSSSSPLLKHLSYFTFHSLSPPVLLSSPLPLFSHSALPLPSYFPLHFSPFLPLHLRSWHIPPGEAEGLYSLLVALGVTTVNLEPVIPPGGGDTLPGTIENTLFKTITPLQLKRPMILVWGGGLCSIPPPSILTGELRSKNNILKWQN
jgi:hypothetical protein